MKVFSICIVGLLIIALAGIGGMIWLGGPREPTPLTSIQDDVRKRDRSGAPDSLSFRARDGASLSYRLYRTQDGTPAPMAAVLIHGSAGGGINMHEVAVALQKAGIDAIAPDMRGHGGSGRKGDITYVGQLEDDLADLLGEADRIGLSKTRVVVGHSAGGGFLLRQAGTPLWQRFAGVVLLAPYVGYNAPTSKPNDGWAGVGLGRIYGLMAANRIGIHAFDGLPALAFGVPEQAKPFVTATYSYRLMQNFGPGIAWRANIEKLAGNVRVLVGEADELFLAERYRDVLGARSKVKLIPGVSHMGITGDPVALAAVVAAAREIGAGVR